MHLYTLYTRRLVVEYNNLSVFHIVEFENKILLSCTVVTINTLHFATGEVHLDSVAMLCDMPHYYVCISTKIYKCVYPYLHSFLII